MPAKKKKLPPPPAPPDPALTAFKLVRVVDADGAAFYRALAEGEAPAEGEIVEAELTAFVGDFRRVALPDGTILMVDVTIGADTRRPPANRRPRIVP